MRPGLRVSVLSLAFFATSPFLASAEEEKPVNSSLVAEKVYNLNRTKILQSNTPSLRPGSVYDVITYFESLLRAPRPGYNYEFIDSGLGATEPLYPMMQKGHQASYAQLIPAAIWEDSRHIDHQSSLETPEGCKVDSAYLLRHIDEYPKTTFEKERKEGYTRVVVRLEHYTRLRPDAECGRHVAHDPDPNFDPMKFMWDHRDAMSLADFPQKELQRFEAKLSVNYPMKELRDYDQRKPFDLNDLKRNSLWYYPDGHAFDYGIDTPRPQKGLKAFSLPRQMVVEATPEMRTEYPLGSLLQPDEFAKLLDFLKGQPFPGYDPSTEPGNDTLRLSDVTPNNVYTSGLVIQPIRDVEADVADMAHFRLVGMTMKPQEPQLDAAWTGERIIPQVRFTYQMINPLDPIHMSEQLFLHLKWDVVDRLADDKTRAEQQRHFMTRLDELTRARESGNGDGKLRDFIREFTTARPVHGIQWGSALTGIWIFGNLERHNLTGQLAAAKTIRQGIDYGYYSSVYDTDLLRAEIEKSQGARKAELTEVLSSLTVDTFRDPKRQDVHAIRFNTVSCAQCHQLSGRDGVHMSINDGINSKIKSPTIVSEYFFHEADAQLRGDMQKWLAAN
ncbi:hypothetical protein [Flaviflagellibacter deserti]|uniref:Cytochrome c domain-containing protein n=1 Tax=Flaviflagellibacter deserti TaxID=2267266 RepID=A0ABV9Z273_9HYPH